MKRILLGSFFALAFGLLMFNQGVSAIDITPSKCAAIEQKDCAIINENKLDNSKGQPTAVKSIINTALIVLGMVSVLMIVIGGFKYTASNGDASIVTSAKNTILFAVIGLIVAMLSFGIVNFVVKSL